MSQFIQRIAFAAVICLSPLLSPSAHAGFFDKAKGVLDTLQNDTQGSSAPSLGGALSSSDIISGLKEALRVGSEKVISQVSKPDGYLSDQAIHIPLPENLTVVHNTLQKFGLGSLTADLETRINRAAEKAAPAAKEVFFAIHFRNDIG